MKIIILSTLLLAIIGCSSSNKQEEQSSKNTKGEKQVKLIRIDEPQNGDFFKRGEEIDIKTQPIDNNMVIDSIIITTDNTDPKKIDGFSTTIPTSKHNVGILKIKATAWSNRKRQTASINVLIKSDITPKKLGYKVVKTYNHDTKAYTQGLFFHNGYLYEGTGQNGESSIRKVDISTGKIEQSYNLNQEHFGEGITLFNNRIYQLTWTSGIGFIYELESFKNIGSFMYNTQGWGLTNNGKELIMSDGSNKIYFIEPQNFSEIRRIEVYDNNGPIKMLNELEYIDGKIYANVYLTDNIVVIDPKTGMVTATIDFSGILKEAQRNGNEDVFNGIAHDPATNRIFVTGKYWGKLFQIEIQ